MRRAGMVGRGSLAAWLATMWVLLWGEVTVANVVNGALIGLALAAFVTPSTLGDDHVVIRPLPALAFALWFAKALVVSNLAVAREVLAPASRSDINPAIIGVRLRTRSGRLATVIANAITLTPGTMTIEARGRPAVLFIHVMSYADRAAVIADVVDLERRVVGAFGSPSERAAICGVAEPAPEEVGS